MNNFCLKYAFMKHPITIFWYTLSYRITYANWTGDAISTFVVCYVVKMRTRATRYSKRFICGLFDIHRINLFFFFSCHNHLHSKTFPSNFFFPFLFLSSFVRAPKSVFSTPFTINDRKFVDSAILRREKWRSSFVLSSFNYLFCFILDMKGIRFSFLLFFFFHSVANFPKHINLSWSTNLHLSAQYTLNCS